MDLTLLFTIFSSLLVGVAAGAAFMHAHHKDVREKEAELPGNEDVALVALHLVLRCKYAQAKDTISELLAPEKDLSSFNRNRVRIILTKLDLIKSNHL